MGNLPERDNVTDALVILHIASWEFGNELTKLIPKVTIPESVMLGFEMMRDIENGDMPWRQSAS